MSFRMGWVPTLTFIGYGKKFQKHRRLIQQTFTRQQIEQYRHIQIKEAHRLALNLLEHQDEREAMLRRSVLNLSPLSTENETLQLFSFSTSIIMRIAYGHEVVSDDDPYVEIARESGYAFTHCGPAGSTPVDLFPIREFVFPDFYQPTDGGYS